MFGVGHGKGGESMTKQIVGTGFLDNDQQSLGIFGDLDEELVRPETDAVYTDRNADFADTIREDIYGANYLDDAVEDDIISDVEAGFMRGWLESSA
jgi:hypothetical protein